MHKKLERMLRQFLVKLFLFSLDTLRFRLEVLRCYISKRYCNTGQGKLEGSGFHPFFVTEGEFDVTEIEDYILNQNYCTLSSCLCQSIVNLVE